MRPIDADVLKQMIDFRMWDVNDDYPHDEASNRISEDHAVKKIIDEMPTVKLRIISYPYPNGLMSEPGVLLKDIEKAPTIDAVPVIRCNACKYGKEDEDGTIECTFWDFMDHTHHNDPEGFCYRAEPKETE